MLVYSQPRFIRDLLSLLPLSAPLDLALTKLPPETGVREQASVSRVFSLERSTDE